MKGLSLSTSDQGSVVRSNTSNIHLDGGTQLILRTEWFGKSGQGTPTRRFSSGTKGSNPKIIIKILFQVTTTMY
jgi:hypothetical protein